MSRLAERWALRVSLENCGRAGCLRTIRGTEAAIVGDDVWFCGVNLDDELLPTLAAIADGPVYVLTDNDWLTPVRHRVPAARLPAADFGSVEKFLTPVLPTSQLAGNIPQTAKLQLVRSTTERTPELWCGSSLGFRVWAETAPEIRLQACRYALSGATCQALVRGNPLPPLTGQQFWLAGKVAIPLGWHWSPSIDTTSMNELIVAKIEGHLSVAKSAIIVWRPASESDAAERIEVIAGTSFIPTTRSNVRNIPL